MNHGIPPDHPLRQAARFSNLKALALSAAHYRHLALHGMESTRGMRVGTIAHHLVLGARPSKPIVLYTGGDRRGKDWESFRARTLAIDPRTEIMTQSEWDDGEAIAAAVLADPVASKLLAGTRREVGLSWESGGMPCTTDGIDFVGDGYIGELKISNTSEPGAFSRLATRMLYFAQCAWYEEGANANGIATDKGVFIIAAEAEPPHVVTCFRLPPETLAQGRKSCAIWMGKLRTALENDVWAGYSQCIVDYDLPAWMGDGDDDA